MQEVKQEIAKELYEDYMAMKYKDRNELLKVGMPTDWIFGYGYYGHRLMSSGGKYYVVYSLGETCD